MHHGWKDLAPLNLGFKSEVVLHEVRYSRNHDFMRTVGLVAVLVAAT